MMPADRGSYKPQPSQANRLRNLLALLLLGAVAALCFSLGMWQLGRAAERDALQSAIERGRLQAPIELSAAVPAAALVPWRAATAQGRWSPEHTVLLENRNLGGRPGYWVATPLLLEAAPLAAENAAGSTGGDTAPGNAADAVLVLRGWLPRNLQAGSTPPALPQEPGLVQIRGELHSHVPRIFELWEWAGGKSSVLPAALPQSDGATPLVQNLDLAAYAKASGLRLLPIVLAQTQDTLLADSTPAPAADLPPLEREWPGPSLDSDQNRGYALQWFSFCAIAVIAALFIARGMLRRNRPATSGKETP